MCDEISNIRSPTLIYYCNSFANGISLIKMVFYTLPQIKKTRSVGKSKQQRIPLAIRKYNISTPDSLHTNERALSFDLCFEL